MWAAAQGHIRLVELLLRHGADAEMRDNDGGTALMRAALNGHERVVDLLLRHGAEANVQDSNGDTALLYAAHGHERVVEVLLQHGAEDSGSGTLRAIRMAQRQPSSPAGGEHDERLRAQLAVLTGEKAALKQRCAEMQAALAKAQRRGSLRPCRACLL